MAIDPHKAAQIQDQKVKRFKQLDRLAWLLDSSIPIPGTKRTIGLDGLMGLIPGIGDLAGGAASGFILFHAVRMGVPVSVLITMAFNILLEAVLGTIPMLGDLFDFMYKANRRNVDLMRNYMNNPARVKRRSTWTVALVILVLLVILFLLVWLAWSILAAIFGAVFV